MRIAWDFGLRGEGYAPYVADFRTEFTPVAAFDRMWRHTIPGILFSTLGWGDYFPNMLLFDDPARNFPKGAWLLPLPALLALLPLMHGGRRLADMFCAAIFALTLAALFSNIRTTRPGGGARSIPAITTKLFCLVWFR